MPKFVNVCFQVLLLGMEAYRLSFMLFSDNILLMFCSHVQASSIFCGPNVLLVEIKTSNVFLVVVGWKRRSFGFHYSILYTNWLDLEHLWNCPYKFLRNFLPITLGPSCTTIIPRHMYRSTTHTRKMSFIIAIKAISLTPWPCSRGNHLCFLSEQTPTAFSCKSQKAIFTGTGVKFQ